MAIDEPSRVHPSVELVEARFHYRDGPDLLYIPSLLIGQRERVFLHGPSGSGKTTLLGLLAGVLCPTEGSIRVLGQDLARLTSPQRDAFRGAHIGYIFQLFNLIPYLSVAENIALPCRLHRRRRHRLGGRPLSESVHDVAEQLGIAPLLSRRVTGLSVGEQQRVAAARALLGGPEVVLADEPTSALDTDHRQRFLELLFACVEEAGSTLIFVSHDRTLMPLFQRALSLPAVNRILTS